MLHQKVIVFGATGNVGSIAATTAESRGSHVTLALRDISKSIPGLSASEERSGNYTRVRADLSQPDSITAAVHKSGATAAFLYLAFGSQDNMLSAFQALRAGGIQHVVFLSSFTIQVEDLTTIPATEILPYVHAQAEISLRKTFEKSELVAIRPGGFATNVLTFKKGIQQGRIRHYAGEAVFDYVTPDDMGEVAGAILREGQQNGQDVVYLFGPEWLSMNAAYSQIGRIIGQDIMLEEVSQDEAVKLYVDAGQPPPVANYFMPKLKEREQKGPTEFENTMHAEALENTRRYTGREPLTFKHWAQKRKDLFV